MTNTNQPTDEQRKTATMDLLGGMYDFVESLDDLPEEIRIKLAAIADEVADLRHAAEPTDDLPDAVHQCAAYIRGEPSDYDPDGVDE